MLTILARAKGLRGKVWNPFGYHAEARLHRDILAWYDALIDQFMANDPAVSDRDDWPREVCRRR